MPERRRMTRREIWNQIGVSVAGWFMLFSLVRVWWKIYILYRDNGPRTDAAGIEPNRPRRHSHWLIGRGET